MRVLGLDIGTSSIGWCVLENDKILGIGVRAFPTKQGFSGQSPFQSYIAHRATRRQNKAYKIRLKRLAAQLIEFGMLPKNKFLISDDARALLLFGKVGPLTAFHFGSVIMFLAKHRGSIPSNSPSLRAEKRPFNCLPIKNQAWQRRDATHLFAKLWRFQRLFSKDLTRNRQIEIARHLFSRAPSNKKPEPKEDLAPYRTANQLELVINAILKKFGFPQLICTELFKLPKRHTLQNQTDIKVKPAFNQNLIHQLWHELPEIEEGVRQCIYSGDLIRLNDLATEAVQIDHIIPTSRGGSNKKENLLLCTKSSNLEKANKAPNQVPTWQKKWPEILRRAENLPQAKLLKIQGKKIPKQRFDFDKKLGLLSKRTWQICSAAIANRFKNTSTKIVCTSGHETSKFREIWDLDQLIQPFGTIGSRHDQRHHAIDAFVLAAASSGMARRLLGSQLKQMLSSHVNSMVTSYKADHKQTAIMLGRATNHLKSSGFLARETSYGPTKLFGRHGRQIGVIRQPISELKKLSDVGLVRDALLRDMLTAKMAEKCANENSLNQKTFADEFLGVRAKKVRVFEPILNAIQVTDSTGKVVKLLKPGANHCFDVWQLPNGKWQSETVTLANLCDSDWQSQIKSQYPTARKVLKLHHDDCIAVQDDLGVSLLRVAKFCANDRIYLVPINAAGDLKLRDADPGDFLAYSVRSAAGLKLRQARQVRIDILGQVFDPRFQKQNLAAKSLKQAGVS